MLHALGGDFIISVVQLTCLSFRFAAAISRGVWPVSSGAGSGGSENVGAPAESARGGVE